MERARKMRPYKRARSAGPHALNAALRLIGSRDAFLLDFFISNTPQSSVSNCLAASADLSTVFFEQRTSRAQTGAASYALRFPALSIYAQPFRFLLLLFEANCAKKRIQCSNRIWRAYFAPKNKMNVSTINF